MSDRTSGSKDTVEGTFDEAKGRGKEAWGDLSNDEGTRTEGRVDQAKGTAKQAWGDAKDKAGDMKEKVSG